MIRNSLCARSREIPGFRRAQDIQEMRAPIAWQKIFRVGRVGNPQLRLASRKPKLGRGDADDGKRAPIQRQLFAQDVGIAAKAALP